MASSLDAGAPLVMNNWLRLDELENAIDNLEMCARLLATIDSERRWKWGILTLHQALYGFAICAVGSHTDPLSVLRNPKNHESHLISVQEALKRCKDRKILGPSVTPLTTTPDEDQALDRLIIEFRNGFEHFRPAAWSIETSGMPELFQHALRVICGIALDSGSVRYYSSDQEDRVRTALSVVASSL